MISHGGQKGVWWIGCLLLGACMLGRGSTSARAAGETTLVRDGKSDYSIVISASARPAVRHGAEELRQFLRQMTGGDLPIVTDDKPLPARAILIGPSKHLDALGVKLDAGALGNEGFVLKTVGDHLVIAGPGERGSMYGCYTLLDKLGVRFFTPKVTHVPHRSEVTLAALDETQVPSFEYRVPFFFEAFDKDWAVRNRTNSQHAGLDASVGGAVQFAGPFVHSFDYLIPPSLYEKHPEYFPLVNGKRINGYVQRCLSNPEVLKLTIDAVSKWIADQPDATLFSVSQNDTGNWCQCDQCNAIAQKYGGQSGLYVWFVNQVAEAIEKDHPDKLIETLAYQFTEAPPTGIKPRPNVRIRLCPINACQAHPYEQCTHPNNKAFVERLKGWSKITDGLYIWHYNTDFGHYLMPFPDFAEFPAETRLYKASGVKGIFFQGDYAPGGGGSDAELRSWVMARLLWDHNADADALVTEWMNGVYGPAGKPMRQYFDLLHEQFRPADNHLFIYDAPRIERFTPEVLKRSNELFDEAEKLAENDVQRWYLKKERLGIRYVDLIHHPDTGEKLKQFLADCRDFGITQLNEGRNIDQWEKDCRAQWTPKG